MGYATINGVCDTPRQGVAAKGPVQPVWIVSSENNQAAGHITELNQQPANSQPKASSQQPVAPC